MGWNWFAMFLWVKSAPGGAEKIVPSATRESLHNGPQVDRCRNKGNREISYV